MADRMRLSILDVEGLVAELPALPIAYLNYMRDVGWGEAPSGHMIYSGPIMPNEVYPQLDDKKGRILIGDDMQGYCLGYDFASKTFGEFSDFGVWSSFDGDFDLAAYLTEDAA
jgi:hypothetical protein